MVARLDKVQLLATREIVAAPTLPAQAIPAQRACEDRSFGLPPALHLATFGLFLAYIGVMAVGFRHQEMVIPVAVFAIFIAAFCAVPALWTLIGPDERRTRAPGWAEFLERGLETETGHASGKETVVLVLMLPVLILCWGLAVVTIAALV